MFSNLEFFIVEAFRSFRRNLLMSLVAVGTITVSLVIFGTFLLLVINLGNVIGTVSSRVDISAYVNQDLSLESAGALQLKLSKMPGVERVDFISRNEAWKKFKEEFGSNLDLDAVVRDNPLPHTFIIRVKNPELIPAAAKSISAIETIDEVRYSGKLIDQIRSLIDAIRIGGGSLVILISFATLLIIVNTVRLTVLARETDISIMKLVGATNNFVKWPFIIEGVLLGVLGGVASAVVMKFSYDAVIIRISKALPFMPLVTDQRFLTFIYFVLVVGGMGLGMLGSYISVSRVLKNEV